MMLEFYRALPDYMPVEELKKLFYDFLNRVMASEYDLVEALESLLELADRQWHTYELLDQDIKNEIEDWLISVNDFNSEEVIEYVTSIIGRLGLVKLYAIVKASLKNNLRKEVQKVIEETVKEIDEHAEDPYFGMK